MKKYYLTLSLLFYFYYFSASAQVDSLQVIQQWTDSINSSFTYQHGVIQLKEGVASINVPAGFKFLDAKQSNYVISDLWGNPTDSTTLGMLFPEAMNPLDDNVWAFDITYDDMGYVEDDDADNIDYDDLLKDIQEDFKASNTEREKAGYEPITMIGWAAKPFYDKDKHILHWAKELKFGQAETNTLNYNIRVLARKGVLVLNAIAAMPDLPQVNKHVEQVAQSVTFTEGNTYADYSPGVDKVAAYTIGGLVAGKVLAKVGFWAVLAKFAKFIVIGVGAAIAFVWKLITGKKEDEKEETIAS
jgi:uncharacterized membrane-anchored protein